MADGASTDKVTDVVEKSKLAALGELDVFVMLASVLIYVDIILFTKTKVGILGFNVENWGTTQVLHAVPYVLSYGFFLALIAPLSVGLIRFCLQHLCFALNINLGSNTFGVRIGALELFAIREKNSLAMTIATDTKARNERERKLRIRWFCLGCLLFLAQSLNPAGIQSVMVNPIGWLSNNIASNTVYLIATLALSIALLLDLQADDGVHLYGLDKLVSESRLVDKELDKKAS